MRSQRTIRQNPTSQAASQPRKQSEVLSWQSGRGFIRTQSTIRQNPTCKAASQAGKNNEVLAWQPGSPAQDSGPAQAGQASRVCNADVDRKSTRLNSSHLGISY